MKISMKNSQDKKPANAPKMHQSLKQSPVFSYTLKKGGTTVVLSQLETGFSYTMKMERLDGTLRLTQFTLTQNVKLADLSSELNDAAVLEIFLQALMMLFAQAQKHQAAEILFMLSQEDADQLAEFTGFFDEQSCVETCEGLKIAFTIYNTPMTRAFLTEKAKSILISLKQTLWQEQRYDRFLRHFLQTAEKGKPFFETIEKAPPSVSGKVLPFRPKG